MEKVWFFCFVSMFFMACLAMNTPPNFTIDYFALLEFKARIMFQSHNVLAHNWSAATSCCSWIGVTCGARHQRVVALNLSHMDLTGTIPPHLGNLSFLAKLSIRNNSFHGHLPDELGFLHRLKVFDLGVNNFDGGIPLWLGILPTLENLFLDSNSFSGTIPSIIFNISSLQIFALADNNLSGEIPHELGYLHNLEKLYASENNFIGPIPSVVFNISSMRVIDLSFNKLSGNLPSGIYNCSQLQILDLGENKFTGSIPREIGNLTMLSELSLEANNLEGEILHEMGYLHNLEILKIGGNSLTGSIPYVVFNISSLEEVSLENNSLSGSLPMDMCDRIPALKDLSLYNNKFTGSIPRGLGNCTSLTRLVLGRNMLSGAIPHEMGNFRNLKILSLGTNRLRGIIPSKIFNISTMEKLDLTDNRLSGQLPSRIGLCLPNLQKLFLADNELLGVIPSSITNASKLTDLELSYNSFTGFIPNTLGNLRLLEWLNIMSNFLSMEYSSTLESRFLTSLANCKYLMFLGFSNNPIDGILPISIGNLSTSLEQFYANDCKIKGNIPKEIGNLSNLISLVLGNNEFTGSIPTTVGRLWKLQGLYLADNKLQGCIPHDLCYLKNLDVMDFGGNKLSGSIPACMDNLTSLRHLYLSSNKLPSIIPTTLWGLTYLLDLYLSTNSLSGYLSPDIGNLKVVININLSSNQLSGDIPSTIGGLQNLVNLSLADNKLQGPIPQSFGKLISIVFLDLSRNNLSEVIPKSLEALLHLKYLNVSFNRLEGEIPNGGPFINFLAQSFFMNDALCGPPISPCKSRSLRRSRTIAKLLLKYILPVIASTVLIVALIFFFTRYPKRNVRHPTEIDLSPLAWRRISYQELQNATDGFCESNLLGAGSFGSVYKGILSDGLTVAIKVFNLQIEGAFKSFDAECEVLRNIRHRNLIKIINSCVNIDFKALILEYMPNESLEKWLYSYNYYLDIQHRLNIMIDVAAALEYLHHGYSTPIVHCDLKPSNVLLDEDMVAHVADFGIAKLLGEEESMKQTKTLATIGYMAPEYGSEGVVSPRGDVYSYGILLLETFVRKRPTDEMFVGERSLKHWVRESLSDAVMEVADSNLLSGEKEHFPAKKDCILSTLKLALDCCVELPEERINIKDVLVALNSIKTKFQMSIAGTRNM